MSKKKFENREDEKKETPDIEADSNATVDQSKTEEKKSEKTEDTIEALIKYSEKQEKHRKRHKSSRLTNRVKDLYRKIFAVDIDAAYVTMKDGSKKISSPKVMYITVRTKMIPMAVAGALVLIGAAAFNYGKSESNINTTMSLNYENSNKGLYPNGSRFNMSLYHSDEVMSLAIQYAGLTDEITPEELGKCITIVPILSSTSSGKYFIATSFSIKYQQPDAIKNISAHDMMQIINKAYTDYFVKNYAYNVSFSNFEVASIEDDDIEYKQYDQEVSTRIGQLERLLSQRLNESPSYRSENTGQSFRNLNQLLSNLKSQQLDMYNSYVTKNGIAKDKDDTIAAYDYRNKVLGIQRDRFKNEYDIRNEAVDIYERAIIESVLVPTVDKNHQFYMSRTKIGIDDITSDATDYLDKATSTQTSIDINQNYINNILYNYNLDYTSEANKYAKAVYDEMNRVEDLILTTDKDYVASRTNSYITFKVSSPSTLRKINLKASAMPALAAVLIEFLLCYRELMRKLKRSKKNEKI